MAHTFEPSEIQLPQIFSEYVIEDAIVDTTLQKLSITNILGGSCRVVIGTASIKYFVRDVLMSSQKLHSRY